jgi:hypothetical protein
VFEEFPSYFKNSWNTKDIFLKRRQVDLRFSDKFDYDQVELRFIGIVCLKTNQIGENCLQSVMQHEVHIDINDMGFFRWR